MQSFTITSADFDQISFYCISYVIGKRLQQAGAPIETKNFINIYQYPKTIGEIKRSSDSNRNIIYMWECEDTSKSD